MRWAAPLLAALAGLAQGQGGQTMLRFQCTNIVIDRIDPLVNPGQIPSTHMHQIVGGNHFNATMTTEDVSKKATCTSCIFAEDFSNYWTANLYFRSKNDTYKRVMQHGSALQFNDKTSNQAPNGVLVYYVSYAPGQITAFKPGFRMLVGDANNRERDPTLARQNCFRCYTGPNFGGDVGAPCMDNRVDTQALPTKPCPGGIRSNILFKTCWDGKNLDTPNHQDHVAYPTTGPANFLGRPGACPSTHPVRIPQLMYEVVWRTDLFNAEADFSDPTRAPFVFSQGDPTGYGQHGDYVFGWKDDSLQKMMDASGCFGAACPAGGGKTQPLADMLKCTVPAVVNEDVDGFMTELPSRME